jgi:hypothetical protein
MVFFARQPVDALQCAGVPADAEDTCALVEDGTVLCWGKVATLPDDAPAAARSVTPLR